MSDDSEIEFDATWQGARLLSAAGREFGAQRADFGVAASPWGADAAGRAFEERYRPVESQVLAAWEQLSSYVVSLGDAAANAAQDKLDAEVAARADRADRADRDARADRGAHAHRADRGAHADRGDRGAHADRADRGAHADRLERP